MKPTDLQPADAWAALERELAERSGLTSVVFDAENNRVTDTVTWANELCPRIKGNPDSASQICAVAQQSMLAAAAKTGKPMVEECDAGMLKVVVPILIEGELVGSVSGCGRLDPASELETDYIAQATGQPPEEVATLARSIQPVTEEQAEAHAAYIIERLQQIVAGRK